MACTTEALARFHYRQQRDPMTLKEAESVLKAEDDRRPGWDRRVETAIVTVFGGGNVEAGRAHLREQALALIALARSLSGTMDE